MLVPFYDLGIGKIFLTKVDIQTIQIKGITNKSPSPDQTV